MSDDAKSFPLTNRRCKARRLLILGFLNRRSLLPFSLSLPPHGGEGLSAWQATWTTPHGSPPGVLVRFCAGAQVCGVVWSVRPDKHPTRPRRAILPQGEKCEVTRVVDPLARCTGWPPRRGRGPTSAGRRSSSLPSCHHRTSWPRIRVDLQSSSVGAVQSVAREWACQRLVQEDPHRDVQLQVRRSTRRAPTRRRRRRRR